MKQGSIKELSLEELKLVLEGWREPAFHARQIFAWIYKKGAAGFNDMSDLPLSLRKSLGERFRLFDLELKQVHEGRDSTKKLLLVLKDGFAIEAVIIPAEGRVTGCISSQVGCKYACSFCASGMLGFRRNLTSAEMVEEVLYLKNNSPDKRLTHIVYMGTGEPLDNYDNVLKAIRTMNSAEAFGIGARRITISTCGVVPGIDRLAQERLQVELSVSLHAADDRIRSKLMPVNKVYPLGELIDACRRYSQKTNRQVTFEYVLLKNINSDLQSAQKLSRIMKGMDCKVNLIPFNCIKERSLEPPNKLEVLLFRDRLIKAGVRATLRKARGQDINSACGQLRLSHEKK